ncbi:response regulator transcription factor [Gloeothece verrucosa]|uniref:Transcriptional regulator, LuxR family n=1 Tax=Gloeothece verrucosa (strain PCC 7822) TaxID=497965 RepID=E0UNR8_GLOV7|nr:LuxR C-terminal-related transcriptional regulator [Gloeothece verrucosa]ADN18598.1 transcriptional regulator, LuxR family [Gloeothece verrucosa PCC 7822]
MDLLIETQNVPNFRSQWSLIIFSNNFCLKRGIQEILSTSNKYKIISIISSVDQICPTLEKVKPDFFLISHPEQTTIASWIKEVYPSVFVLTWDSTNGGDACIFSSLPLIQQLDKIVLSQSVGELPVSIRRLDIYYELVKKTFISSQEQKMLHYLSYGYSYTEIAEALDISLNTLKNYMTDLREKLNAKDKTHLVVIALRTGLVV